MPDVKVIIPTITVSTSPAYTAGDNVGGKITLTGVQTAAGKGVVLYSIHMLDRAAQSLGGNILLFNADPTVATITDNAAFVFSTDDLKEIARIPFSASDFVTVNSKQVADLNFSPKVISLPSGVDLYAAIVLTSTPTFAATTDLQVAFGFIRD